MRGCAAAGAAAVVLAVLATGPRVANCTSYNPLSPDECSAATILTPGTTVYLFHSGTEETQRRIRAGDILTVFRGAASGREATVGTIRVDAAFGGVCFRGEVLTGELRPHDVAAAGPVTCLVLAGDAPCLHGIGP